MYIFSPIAISWVRDGVGSFNPVSSASCGPGGSWKIQKGLAIVMVAMKKLKVARV